jgi:glucose uptake protein GlcU
MTGSEKCVAIGTLVSGLGGALLVAYFIYSLESTVSFWTWPGLLAIILTSVGLLIIVVGALIPNNEATQRQAGGRNARNMQAGRDIVIKGGDSQDD